MSKPKLAKMDSTERANRFLALDADQRAYFGLYLANLIDSEAHDDLRESLREAFESAEQYKVGTYRVV